MRGSRAGLRKDLPAHLCPLLLVLAVVCSWAPFFQREASARTSTAWVTAAARGSPRAAGLPASPGRGRPLRAASELSSSPSAQLLFGLDAALLVIALAAVWFATERIKSRLDPGRAGLSYEYLRNAQEVLRLPLDGGGSLTVTRHAASESSAPEGAPEGAGQEWRVLRFVPAEGSSDLVQAVAKVGMDPPLAGGGMKIVGSTGRIWQLGDVLPLAYTKTFVSVVIALLRVLGSLVLEPRAGSSGQGLRFLCIGLGGGTMASFLAHALPGCSVDVAELEPAVIRAATEAMGLIPSDRLRVTEADGAAFALEAVEHAEESDEGAYDAVLVDAYDAAGGIPEALCTPGTGLALALERGLLPRFRGGLVATNLLPDLAAEGALAAYGSALAARGGGPAFSIRELDPRDGCGMGNIIAVQTCGDAAQGLGHSELETRLQRAGGEVTAALRCPFDMAELAVRCFSAA